MINQFYVLLITFIIITNYLFIFLYHVDLLIIKRINSLICTLY